MAEIVEREVMRYSPAGIPIINAKLQHASQQEEAGVLRQVEVEIHALAAGDLASRLEQVPLNAKCLFQGFLAKRSYRSKSLVFHIIDISVSSQTEHLDTGANHGIR